MKFSTYKQTLVLCFLFSSTIIYGQATYKSLVQKSSLNLEGKVIEGYSSNFDFSREEVRRGWWEYARKFGSPINMKTFYKVKISSDYTDGNSDLMLYAKADASQQGVSFFLGVGESEFKDQVKSLLLDFKKDFYIKSVIKKMEDKEKEVFQLSESYCSNPVEGNRDRVLSEILKLRRSVKILRDEIKEIITD